MDEQFDVPGVISSPPAAMHADVVVIGSGPGGAIAASTLAEAGLDVLVVEDGPLLGPESCRPFSRREMVQKYRNGGVTVAAGRCKVAYVEARCAGGGSEVNSGLYHRTPPDVLDQWTRDYKVEAMTADDLEPHFVACERDLKVSYLPGAAPAASLKLHDGARALGWSSIEVPRWFSHEEGGPAGGTRQSMTRTYLPRALAAGARLLPNARVGRLSRAAGKWRVRARHRAPDGRPRGVEIRADTVFVAAGAIQSAALLRQSGVRCNIGDHLRLHPTVKVVARFPEEVNPPDMGVPVHQVKHFAPRFSFGCSISAPAYLALAMLDHPRHVDEAYRHARRMAVYYAMTCGGQGAVRTLPGAGDPLVRYHLNDAHLRDLSDGLRELCRCLLASGAEALYPGVRGHAVIRGEADLTRIARPLPATRTNLMTIHLMGTCPMGEDRRRAAVDSFGRVHDADGLCVADASLLCEAPGVNPQGTAMALSRRNALAFIERRNARHGTRHIQDSSDRRGRLAGAGAPVRTGQRVA